MKKEKKKSILTNIILIIIILLISIPLYFLFTNLEIIKNYSTIDRITISLIISGLIVYLFIIMFKQTTRWELIILLIIYGYLIFLLLFKRSTYDEKVMETNFYLFEWLLMIFSNQIVMINIIGNIVLFIPLGMIIKKWFLSYNDVNLITIFSGLITIVTIESLQYFTRKGVFDPVDLLLNSIGLLIGLLFIKKEKRKKYE